MPPPHSWPSRAPVGSRPAASRTLRACRAGNADSTTRAPGLVAHHYGSMEGLQVACDEHVAATVRDQQQHALTRAMELDPLASIRGSDLGRLVRYVARRLTEDSPTVAKLVDDLVADAEDHLGQAEEEGVLRPTDDARGRAVVSTIYSLGARLKSQS